MIVEAVTQCDANSGGQRKALFPGQRYDLDEDAVTDLLAQGKVRIFGGAPGVFETESTAPVEVKVVSRPRATRRKS